MRIMKIGLATVLLSALAGPPLLRAADDAKPPPKPRPVKQDRLTRITNAVETMEQALLDLPPGPEVEQIRNALDRLHVKLKAISLAQSELEQQKERAAWAERMVTKKYMTQQQAEAEKALLKKYENALDRLKKDLDGLADHPKERLRNKLKEIEEAETDLAMQQDYAAWAARMVKKGYLAERDAQFEKMLVREYEIT